MKMNVNIKPNQVVNGQVNRPTGNTIDILNLTPAVPDFEFTDVNGQCVCHISLCSNRERLELSGGTDENYRNRGYFTKAVGEVVNWLKNNTSECVVWAVTTNNTPSDKALAKNGFVKHPVDTMGTAWHERVL